jgi:hypothetical protein
MNQKLPPLSDREIYAMSHPDAPDFESEAMSKSWFDPNYKRPMTTPLEQAGLVRTKATTNLFGSMFDFIEDRK